MMSLYWRFFVINAVLVGGATAALALSPATVSADLLLREVVVLAIGLALVLVLNFLLVRRTLVPLERLRQTMHRVDLLRPGRRLLVAGGGREVTELTSAFNQMLERLEVERRQSGARAIQAQEHERRRIALELHDEVGQLLTGVVLALDGLGRSVPPAIQPRVEELQGIVREGAEHVRSIARGLRPESLEELGLRTAIVSLTSGVAAQGNLEVKRVIGSDLPPLPPDTELVVYRVAQESLTNVLRHADARHVEVTLQQENGHLALEIADDGRGIDVQQAASGRGLAGMLERAVYVGGRLEVERRRPTGTVVSLRVPIGGGGA
jgi:two-component system, NarL family, sensor histidine kinase UhpB